MNVNRIWRDSNGKVVLWQAPNVWLLIWLVSDVANLIIGRSKVESVIHWVGSATLIIWALLEVFQGADYFRRALGAVVLLITIVSIFMIGL